MNWIELSDLEQVDQIIQQSLLKPQLIFKHSTRCSISSMVKDRL
jgi:bacillithiol system protein YtxJ